MKLKISNKINPKRARRILELYRSGKTLSEIGEIFGFTRSRAQQIVIKEMKADVLKRLSILKLSKDEEIFLDVAVREEIKEILERRKLNRKNAEEQDVVSRISEKMKELPDYHLFLTVSEYARALGEDTSLFKKYFPDIATSIIQKTKKMWSRHYVKCRICGTINVKHMSHGLCENCYIKSDIFKEMQSASRVRNSHKWKKRQSVYAKEYSKRPEVVARAKQREDEKKYGGNREKAIQRDGFRCRKCGISRDDSYKIFKRDLYVYHIKGRTDNNLNNLLTVCKECHNKNLVKIMHEAMKKSKSDKVQ